MSRPYSSAFSSNQRSSITHNNNTTTANNPTSIQQIIQQYQRPGLNEDEIIELYEAFSLFDKNGNGRIDVNELRTTMESLNIIPLSSSTSKYQHNNTTSSLQNSSTKQRLIHDLLNNIKSNELTFSDFLDLMTIRI